MTNYQQLFHENSPNIIKILAEDFQTNYKHPEAILTNFINQAPNILTAAKIIQQTETYLNQESTIKAACFARVSLPLLFQKTYIDTELIQQFAQAAIDDTSIPENWKTTVNWINDNLDKARLSYFYLHQPDILIGIHPLISRKLKNSPTTPKIETYCTWLKDTIFEADNLEIPTTTLLASATLIINQAKQQGITIEADGQLTTSESARRWAELTETVLNKIVIESEKRDITQEINLLNNWHRDPLIYHKRKRSQNRLQETIDKLIKQYQELPSTENQQAREIASKINTTKQELEKRLTSAFAPANLPEIALNNLDIPMAIGVYLQQLIPQHLNFHSQIITNNQSITETLDKLPLWQQTINQSLSDNPTCEEILTAWAKIDIWSELHQQTTPTTLISNGEGVSGAGEKGASGESFEITNQQTTPRMESIFK